MTTSTQHFNLVLLFLTLLAAQVSSAATFVWNVASPAPNNWNVAGNWNPNAPRRFYLLQVP